MFIPREKLGHVEEAIRKIEESVEYRISGGYTEAGILNSKLGIDTINLGPGPSIMAHQTGEYVTIDSLIKIEKIYIELIESYLK